jgi:hypothetical protein
LKLWFEQLPDVYVSGNLFIRYEEDGAEKRIAPDIFVVFGTSKEDRISYTLWEEDGKVPDLLLSNLRLTPSLLLILPSQYKIRHQ